MKRNWIAALIALTWLYAMAFPISAEEKVRVAISNFSASYIPMYLAQKRGYFAEEGLTVEIILMAGLTGTRALIGNSVELGSASNPTAAVQGAKLKILMVFNDKPPGEFMAQPGFKSVAELRGKRIGGSTVGSLDYGWLKEVLPKFGLQLEKDFNFVPVGSTSSRYVALRAGSIDAASLSPPSSLFRATLPASTLFRFADYPRRHSGVHRRHRRALARQADLVRRFMRARSKAKRFISLTVRKASRRLWNLPGRRTVS